MDPDRQILLIAERGELDGYVGRLPELGFCGRTVPSLAAAEQLLGRYERPLRAAVLPTTFDYDRYALALERIRGAAARVRLLAVGERPDASTREAIRRSGVEFLLSEPVRDGELRFFLNAAVWPGRRGDSRRDPRVPTHLVADVRTAAGTKRAAVFNLSATGAYLETSRPSQQDARVQVEIPLPSEVLRLRSRVLLANVVGNVGRDNLPHGMSVCFEDPTPQARAALGRYVEEQAARYRP